MDDESNSPRERRCGEGHGLGGGREHFVLICIDRICSVNSALARCEVDRMCEGVWDLTRASFSHAGSINTCILVLGIALEWFV